MKSRRNARRTRRGGVQRHGPPLHGVVQPQVQRNGPPLHGGRSRRRRGGVHLHGVVLPNGGRSRRRRGGRTGGAYASVPSPIIPLGD